MTIIYSMDIEQMMANLNDAKEVLITRLEADGHLKPESKCAERYAFVVANRGVLGRAVDRLLGITRDSGNFIIMETGKVTDSEGGEP